MSRRLIGLERRCGARLFERTRDGVVPNAAGRRLVACAEEADALVTRFFARVRPSEADVEGTVRVAATPAIVEVLLMPALADFARRHPRLHLEVDSAEVERDLLRREADLAVRLRRPTSEGVVARRIGTSPNAIFASTALAHALGEVGDLDSAPWITWDATRAKLPAARWFVAHVFVEPVVRTSTLLAQVAAAEASVGVALLPAVIAERRGLVPIRLSRKLASTASSPPVDIFLACQAARRHVPRIAAVWTFLLEVFRGTRALGAP